MKMERFLLSDRFLDCLKELYVRLLDSDDNTNMAIEWLSSDTKQLIEMFKKNQGTLTFINLAHYIINDIRKLESGEMRYSLVCNLFSSAWEVDTMERVL
ncbi:hypothetical protein [Bacillus weihaiensis]|uniref:hypothetical protein n=1 Tax=Bacillus weihaiensis TaxID=1547283 RepID=UPI002355F479|nr:hypothetical protein [Bacillus weihaiensis]